MDICAQFSGGSRARVEGALFSRAADDSTAPAVALGSRCIPYRTLGQHALALAEQLQHAGVRAGDRVGLFLDKSLESVVALYASWAAGAVAVPIYEGLRGAQVAHILHDAEARACVSHRRKLRGLSQAARSACAWLDVSTFDLARRASRFEARDLRELAHGDDGAGGDVAAAILYTSGSSGRPKGILLSHRNLIAGARIVPGYLGLHGGDRILGALPFSFDYGLNQLLGSAAVGAMLVLQRSSFPADIRQSLLEHRITTLAGVPPLFIQLAQAGALSGGDFAALRILTNSGGAFPVELVAHYRARLPDARLFLMYGLSEAFRSTYLDPNQLDRRPQSIGKAVPECEVLVLREDGSRCAPGEVGELVHRGPTVALGYWRNPEATARVFRPDPEQPESGRRVVYSGDLVRSDEEGFLYFVARRDQMIKSMGFRISPEEVEELLHRSGMICEAVVGSRPDPVAGAVVVARVVPREPKAFSADALLAFCRKAMPSYMVPREIVTQLAFPRTASGKVDRRGVLASLDVGAA